MNPHRDSSVTIGIDISQKHAPTAIAVVERETRPGTDSHFLVRHLQRLPLNTPYPQVARRLAQVCDRVREIQGHWPEIFVDATGVGTPVVDQLRADSRIASYVWAVYLTHGNRRTERPAERRITLGKASLVSRLQALLQGQRLCFPATAEAQALGRELANYEIRVTENATDRYGAFRVGTHDDLATALGLAVHKPARSDR